MRVHGQHPVVRTRKALASDAPEPKPAPREPDAPAAWLKPAGYTTMTLGLLALAFTPVVGIGPGALLVSVGSYLAAKGGGAPLFDDD